MFELKYFTDQGDNVTVIYLAPFIITVFLDTLFPNVEKLLLALFQSAYLCLVRVVKL